MSFCARVGAHVCWRICAHVCPPGRRATKARLCSEATRATWPEVNPWQRAGIHRRLKPERSTVVAHSLLSTPLCALLCLLICPMLVEVTLAIVRLGKPVTNSYIMEHTLCIWKKRDKNAGEFAALAQPHFVTILMLKTGDAASTRIEEMLSTRLETGNNSRVKNQRKGHCPAIIKSPCSSDQRTAHNVLDRWRDYLANNPPAASAV